MKDPDQVLFDHLGIDHISVDEAHLMRRLANGSGSRDSGFSGGSSKRATDLLLKVETLGKQYPGKPILALYTGTPWSNTLAETWVWQRFLQPDVLDAAGVKAFDPWVATFVKYETAVEVAPDGSGFRTKRRPVGIKNLPELKTMLRQNADIVSPEQIGLARPDFTIHARVADPTPEQKQFVTGLAERADAIRSGVKTPVAGKTYTDSMLLICNDGRKVALDPQLVGIDEVSSKLRLAAADIIATYQANKDRVYGSSPVTGALQLVLLDLGTPHPNDAQTYGRLRSMIVAGGVPADKVRFVHEAKTDKARAALFAQAREGHVAVLFGSTSKVGIGTNVQSRLVSLAHIDVPWLPAEVTQREGRALRPGNLNEHVDIYRYVTEGTFDAYTWAAVERKEKSFYRLYDDDPTVREIDDVGEVALSYGEMKALAAGNPLLLEQATVAAKAQKLRLLRSVFLQSVNRSKKYAAECESNAASLSRRIDYLDRTVATLTAATAADTTSVATVAGRAVAKNTGYMRYPWRGLQLSLTNRKADRGNDDIVLAIDLGYHTVFDRVISKKTLRAGADVTAEAIEAGITNWAEHLPEEVSNLRDRRNEYLSDAAKATQHAETQVFEHEVELDQAIADLARIDALIDADAAENERMAA